MCPRLPRTVPLPWQRGQGTGPKATSPAPRQAAQGSKRTRWTRRAAPAIDSSKLRRVACSRSSPARGVEAVAPAARAESKISRKPTVSMRTRAEKSNPSKPPSAGASTGTAGSSPRS